MNEQKVLWKYVPYVCKLGNLSFDKFGCIFVYNNFYLFGGIIKPKRADPRAEHFGPFDISARARARANPAYYSTVCRRFIGEINNMPKNFKKYRNGPAKSIVKHNKMENEIFLC